ncbi:hypothetical protein Taro_030577 [Colocasia esculenta]|uniref:Uncharacterized protein n=1 Tax=Colocasia esculenta TaxID=4460 RepID=A0A843VMR8_COLES|nr:hypothetical protein [Colocasia esculenta]
MLRVNTRRSLTRHPSLPAELAVSSAEMSGIGMNSLSGNIWSGFRDLFRRFARICLSLVDRCIFCLTSASTLESSCFPRNHRKTEKRFEVAFVGIYLSRGMIGWLPSSRTRRLPTMMDLPDLEIVADDLLFLYGYKDVRKENHQAFEQLLIESLEKFIRREAQERSLESDEDDDMDSDEEPSSTLMVGPNGSVYSLGVPLLSDYNLEQSTSEASTSGQEIDQTPLDARQSLERELSFVHKAKESGVVYLLGHGDIRARKDSWFIKKLIINYFYAFLRKNCRRGFEVLTKAFSVSRLLTRSFGASRWDHDNEECRDMIVTNRADESSVRPEGFAVGFWVIWLARARFDEFPPRGRCVERKEPRTGFVLRILREELGSTSFHREDVEWSGRNLVRASFFVFFAKAKALREANMSSLDGTGKGAPVGAHNGGVMRKLFGRWVLGGITCAEGTALCSEQGLFGRKPLDQTGYRVLGNDP